MGATGQNNRRLPAKIIDVDQEVWQALAKPDAIGEATLFEGPTTREPVSVTGDRDTFTPTFVATWRLVPLAPTTRLLVRLRDEDVAFHDPIGDAIIDYEQLVAAARDGTVYPVNVANQTGAQLLMVHVLVVPDNDQDLREELARAALLREAARLNASSCTPHPYVPCR